MVNVHAVSLLFALVCFVFSAWQSQSPVWNRVVSVGLAALVLSMLPL